MNRLLEKRNSQRLAVVLTFAMILSILAQVAAPGYVSAQDDALSQREFRNLVEDAQGSEPVFGPESGELEHNEETISLEGSNPDLTNLLVTATFANPVAGSRHEFDAGIQIRNHVDNGDLVAITLIVLNSGDWAIFEGTDELLDNGSYDDFDDSRRGENTIALYASGDVVHIGINGDYVGTVEVSVEEEGEVLIGTGFFNDTYVEDGITEYTDFTIWELETSEDTETGDRNSDEPDADAPNDEETDTGDRNDDLGPIVDETEAGTDSDERNDPLEPATATPEPTEEPTATAEPTDELTVTTEPTEENTVEPTATTEPTEAPINTATAEPTAAPATNTPTQTSTEPAVESPTASASTPDLEATPIDGSPVALTSYLEPQYGYSFAYDSSWTVIQDSGVARKPSIQLTNGTSELTVGAIGAAPLDTLATPEEFTAAIIANFDQTNDVQSAEVATDASGDELRGVTDQGGSFVVLQVVMLFGNGDQEEFLYYFEFREIPGQNAVLSIVHSAPAADFDSEAPAREAVISSLTFAPVTATPEATP